MRRKICIVEDDAAVRESLKLVLEVNGYIVEDFETGSAFLKQGDFTRIACIVMDVYLPGGSGLQTLKRLRNQFVTTPVFLVTGRIDDSVRREAIRLNATGIFEKPLSPRTLIDAIKTIESPAR